MISTLVLLSNSLNHKSFRDMKHDDILIYLDSLRKDDASDQFTNGLEATM